EEKSEALGKLADEITRIVSPPEETWSRCAGRRGDVAKPPPAGANEEAMKRGDGDREPAVSSGHAPARDVEQELIDVVAHSHLPAPFPRKPATGRFGLQRGPMRTILILLALIAVATLAATNADAQ